MLVQRPSDLSVPDSGFLPCAVPDALPAAGRGSACNPGTVLSGLRDRRGRPTVAVRLLAVVVALLLAAPLTVLGWRALSELFAALV